jgi:hypothetical protein
MDGEVKSMAEDWREGEDAANQRIESEIANELINFANNKLGTQIHPIIIAAAMRHSAANFTAFAYVNSTDGPLPIEGIVKEFTGMLHNYEGRHQGETRPMTSLEKLVKQVENE